MAAEIAFEPKNLRSSASLSRWETDTERREARVWVWEIVEGEVDVEAD